MTRINLIPQPVKDQIPKVWHDGQWKNADQARVVVMDNTNMVPATVLPREATVANTPEHVSTISWKNGDIVYKNNGLYRANSNIPVDTTFVVGTLEKQWSPVTSISVPNIQDWLVYNPSLDMKIKVGEMFYFKTDLYRCSTDNTSKSITDTVYFEKLTGLKRVPVFSSSLSYTKNEITSFHGILAQANSDITSGTSFEWGTGNTATFRPVLSSGKFQMNWKGIVPNTNTDYSYGDVIVLSNVSLALYMCTKGTGSVTLNSTNTIKLNMTEWCLLLDSIPVTGLIEYLSKSEFADANIVANAFTSGQDYNQGTIVQYGSGYIYLATKSVKSGELFNAGDEWTCINNLNTSTLKSRKNAGHITPRNGSKEYYDTELNVMLLHREDNTWASHDGIKETITFPTSPVNAQAYTTTTNKNVYEYDSTNFYWKLKAMSGGASNATGGNRILVTKSASQSMGTGTGTMWSPDTELFKSGDIALKSGKITLLANRTYDINYQLAITNPQGSGWMSYQIYDYTNNKIPENQTTASFWFNSNGYNDQPNGKCTITVGSTNIEIGIRCGYNGATTTAHSVNGSKNNFSNDGGDCYLEVVEIGRADVADNRVKQETLDGVYADYLHATLSTGSVAFTAVNTDIPFSKNVNSFGEIVNTSGVFTLKAGKTYELTAVCSGSYNYASNVQWNWVDNDGTILQGASAGGAMPSNRTDGYEIQPTAKCIVSPSSDMKVKVRITYMNANQSYTIFRGTKDDTDGGAGGAGGSSYALIKQLGASKIITNVTNEDTTDPKNFVTRDTTTKYNSKKHVIDFYFQTYPSATPAADIALRCGTTDAEKRARFWFLLQKFAAVVGGTDNDTNFDGVFHGVQYETNKQSSLNNAGSMTNSTFTSGNGDVDPIDTANAPSEYYKLVLGKDTSGNIWFVPVTVCYPTGAVAGGTIASIIKYVKTDGAWVNSDAGGNLPALYSCTDFTGTGTPSVSNNITSTGCPMLQYLPHRLELA